MIISIFAEWDENVVRGWGGGGGTAPNNALLSTLGLYC